jgi:hypothetical protein
VTCAFAQQRSRTRTEDERKRMERERRRSIDICTTPKTLALPPFKLQ